MSDSRRCNPLLTHLRLNNVQCRDGLAAEVLNHFEQQHDLSFPREFRAYLTLMNGTAIFEDAEWDQADQEGYCFYSLDAKNLLPSKHFIFCEWLLGFNQFAIDLRKIDGNGAVYHLIDENRGYVIAKNFEDFVALFLQRSDLLINASSLPITNLQ